MQGHVQNGRLIDAVMLIAQSPYTSSWCSSAGVLKRRKHKEPTLKYETDTFSQTLSNPSHGKSSQDVSVRYKQYVAILGSFIVDGLSYCIFVEARADVMDETVETLGDILRRPMSRM